MMQLTSKQWDNVLACCDNIAMHTLTSYPTANQIAEGIGNYQLINDCLLTDNERATIYNSFEREY